MLRLGFLGFGEVGYYMSKGFVQDGLVGVRAFDVALANNDNYAETLRERAKDAGVTFADSLEKLAAECDILVAAVPANVNRELALRALPHMRAGLLYVDVSSSSPVLKAELAADFGRKGFPYVDAVILEGPPAKLQRVKMFCSGEGADSWVDATKPYKTNCEVLDGPAGLAAKVKIIRSAFMKGFEALCIESFLFARVCGIERRIMASIAPVFDGEAFESIVTRMMCTSALHSRRRALEAEDSVALMKAEGVTPTICSATAVRLHATADLGLREELHGVSPENLEALYRLWDSKQYR